MLSNASIVFPFRVITFLIMFILMNIGFYIRDTIAITMYTSDIHYITAANPYLVPLQGSVLNSYVLKRKNVIRDYGISSDVFMVLLFASLIFGISTTRAMTSLIISIFHFIAIILLQHFICIKDSLAYYICSFFFGVFIPLLIEIWFVIAIFVFKVDFYF